MFWKLEKFVDDALPVRSMSVVVALMSAVGCVNASYEGRKSVPATAAPTCPPAVVLRSVPEAREEIHRFVEEAVVAVIIVVDASGIESDCVVGAAKLMVSAGPTRDPVPESEMAVPATGDEVATD